MNKINNTKPIQEFVQQIPTLQNQIVKQFDMINEEMKNYLKFMKNEQFEKKMSRIIEYLDKYVKE